MRSTRRISFSGRPASSFFSSARTASLVASSSNSLGSTEIGCAVTSVRRPACETVPSARSTSASRISLARAEEVPAPAVRVEADDVVREHALVDVPPDRAGEDAPGVALRPRDVDEVAQRRVGDPLANEPRREVEVVVVQEERGVGLALELLDRGRGEGPVDGDVPVTPGALQLVVDVRGACQRPEVVLEEPQRRIRDHVVEALVGQLVVGDETQAVARAVARGLVDRSPGLLRHEPVLVGHRARDPGHLVVRDEAAQRRHEPAAAAPHDPPPRVVAPVRDGPAVGDDDQLPVLRHLV